jgi:dihydroxyacetone kinase
MGLRIASISRGVEAADRAMKELEQALNDADAVIGDGDTGSMLTRVLAAMAKVDLSQAADVGAAFASLARAAASATGSSLGTLLMTALMTMAKAAKGRAELPWPEVGTLLVAAREAMSARGGAQLGDKTVLDGLDSVAAALSSAVDSADPRAIAAGAAHDALDRMRPQPCKVGRARMFPQKSTGADDPGMLAFARLMDALAAA